MRHRSIHPQPEPIPDSKPIAWLTVGELRALVRDEMLRLRREELMAIESDAAGLSLYRAAKLAHRRCSDVRQAAMNGTLTAHLGSNRRWRISAGAVREWVEAGTPVEKA